MIRVFEKPIYESYWENIPLLAAVYIIEKEYTVFNPELLRIEVDPELHADKFKRGILLKKENVEQGRFVYTVKLAETEEIVRFHINAFYFKATIK
jgi:hypothetical protein